MIGERNRITEAIAAMDERIGTLDAERIAVLEGAASLDAETWCKLGDMATRAMIDARLTLDEAQTVHAIHSTFDSESLASRIVFVQLATELLAERIGR